MRSFSVFGYGEFIILKKYELHWVGKKCPYQVSSLFKLDPMKWEKKMA